LLHLLFISYEEVQIKIEWEITLFKKY